ncbi:MAG: hypothetical protein QOH58_253 [Thermoleophilaceae bacterium]|jgi:hypothetical protein|nr:hypothetical protein [Thermoleophilaceae bacterium]
MMRFLVVRLDAVAEHRDRLRTWLADEHLPSAEAVPGLAAGAVLYEAVETPTAVRRYPSTPHFTAVFPLDPDLDPAALVSDQRFIEWWVGAMKARFFWFEQHRWVMCEQRMGPESPFAHDRILFTEVDVAPGHEADWGPWYERYHVPDALAVPNLFDGELRRFESIDVRAERFHCAARPRFLQLLPIQTGTDILESTRAPEFLALAADTQASWGGALTFLSTICERVPTV